MEVKVCIINDNFDMGGVQRVATEIANGLSKEGVKVSLIDFSGKNYYYYKLNKNIIKNNVIRRRSIKRKVLNKLASYKIKKYNKTFSILTFYKEQVSDLISFLKTSNYDVIILCQGLLTAFIPYIKKELPNIKFVAWQHNEFDIYINKYYKKYLQEYLFGIEEADLVVSLTEKDKQKFAAFNNKSVFMYNPLTLSSKRLSSLDNKNIIFVGRIVLEQKGLDYLIEIGKKIKEDWKILVAGDGPDLSEFQKLVLENNLNNKIELKGTLNSDQLCELYQSGSIFISTSRWEGFGLVITEAMAAGLPIVSFKNNGPEEILKNGQYGILVEKNNINEFINHLNNLIESKDKRKNLQEKGIIRIKDFEKKTIIKKWCFYLQKITQER
ncbi:glycosyltransferase [Heyndrickxia ginsengihumi]|uniref:glycosyltransferase n=1 Tax=Heyndrickxia ginsengihumi TaxID=363870 RepID=UPI003D1CD7E7